MSDIDVRDLLADGEYLRRVGDDPDGGDPEAYADDAVIALPEWGDGPTITHVLTGSEPSQVLTPYPIHMPTIVGIGTPSGGVITTSSATSLLTGTFTPLAALSSGNWAAVGDVVEMRASGTITNNTGGTETVVLRWRWGSSNIWTSAASVVSLPTSANGYPFHIIAQFRVNASTTFTNAIGTVNVGPVVTSETSAQTINRTTRNAGLTGTSLSAPSAMDFTVQHSSASSSMATVLDALTVMRYAA